MTDYQTKRKAPVSAQDRQPHFLAGRRLSSLYHEDNPSAKTALAVAAVAAVLIVSSTGWAQQAGAAPSGTIDFTAIAVAAVGGVFSVLSAVAMALISRYVKNETARQVLNAAVTNSIGALQRATQETITRDARELRLPPQLVQYTPAVQYVLDHAKKEADRFGIKPTAIANKIDARLGLANIAHNLAVTANATPEVKPPLSPVQER
jgi:hypothetical protein